MMDRRLSVRPGRTPPVIRKPRKIVMSPHGHYLDRVLAAMEEISRPLPAHRVPMVRARINVPKYSEDFLKLAASELAGDAEDIAVIAWELADGRSEGNLRLNYAFNDLLDGMDYRRVTDHVRSLAFYRSWVISPPTTPDEITSEHLALIKVTHAIMKRDAVDYPSGRPTDDDDPLVHCGVGDALPMFRIKSDDLIRLTLAHAEDVTLITALISATGITDAHELEAFIAFIDSYKDGKQKALNTLATSNITRAVELRAILSGESGTALVEGVL